MVFAEDPAQALWEDARLTIRGAGGELRAIVALSERPDIAATPEARAIGRMARSADRRIRDGVARIDALVEYRYGSTAVQPH